jgi:hypothetical protein
MAPVGNDERAGKDKASAEVSPLDAEPVLHDRRRTRQHIPQEERSA